jgi:chromate transporter
MKKFNFKRALQLFCVFFKIGAFTFGGGYAMIPIIQRETVENKGWISDDDIHDIIAIAESTPGPIAINSATFVGYRVAGVFGAACATFGVVLPSYLLISAIAYLLREFYDYRAVRYAFYGIRAGVLALIFKALYMMFKKTPKEWASYTIMAIAFLVSAFVDINLIFVIIGCAIFGLVYSLLRDKRRNK